MFREEPVVPAHPKAQALAHALTTLMKADAALGTAKKSVPSYTGQWSSKDYYAEEQEKYNRAADAYADAVRVVCGIEPLIPVVDAEQERINALFSQRIEELPLPDRVKRALSNSGCIYIGDYFLLGITHAMLLRTPQLGGVSFKKFVSYLHENRLPDFYDSTVYPEHRNMLLGWKRQELDNDPCVTQLKDDLAPYYWERDEITQQYQRKTRPSALYERVLACLSDKTLDAQPVIDQIIGEPYYVGALFILSNRKR